MLLSSSIFNDYALQTLSTQAPEFPHISVYATCVYRNCQLYLGSYNLRLPTPTLSVWNSLPIFDWTGLEPVTHLPLQNVFPLTPSVNIISVFIHLTIIYMVTDMKIIIYFIKVWFWVVGATCSTTQSLSGIGFWDQYVYIPSRAHIKLTSFNIWEGLISSHPLSRKENLPM